MITSIKLMKSNTMGMQATTRLSAAATKRAAHARFDFPVTANCPLVLMFFDFKKFKDKSMPLFTDFFTKNIKYWNFILLENKKNYFSHWK